LQIIQNFEVSLPEGVTEIPTTKRTFIAPEGQIKILLRERTDSLD
jgi:hypothetical protein